MKKLRPVMFVGTGSDVGKSIINAGFCRILVQDGYMPAPFKAQNMSLNSYATKENLEIGRAQAVQAEACGIECSVDMNPILLKPTSNQISQVVLNGKPAGNKSASDYFRSDNKAELFVEANAAFDRLSAKYNPIVLEGAGSISEMNLWSRDIVNMRMAQYADAATYLVADIDRGGVFASVYGSVMLLPEGQRKLIKGIIVNKFRGDISLFDEGRKIIEQITGVSVVGVLPYFNYIFIEQEDSVVLDYKAKTATEKSSIKVAVIHLKSLSNFTDFNILERTPGVDLFYTREPEELKNADIISIPGSKNTISDLQFIETTGLRSVILEHHEKGKPLYGICGGYQIMGEMVYDPHHIEGDVEQMTGLGVLSVSTTIYHGKVTRQCSFTMNNSSAKGNGYEIHAGVTQSPSPLCTLEDGTTEGCYKNEHCWGSYIHGIMDNKSVIENILKQFTDKDVEVEDYREMKERNYDLLASRMRELLDVEYIYKTMEQ